MDFLLLLRATCNQLGRAGRLIGAVGQHSGPLAVTELILGLVPGIQGSCNPRLSAGGSVVRGDGWSPARPRDEAERVTGGVSVDMFAAEFRCPEGQYPGLG